MPSGERHLRVVGTSVPAATPPPSVDELGVTLMIFLVAAVPLASAVSGVGRWGDGTLGFATLGVLVAGRELGARLIASWRGGREP